MLVCAHANGLSAAGELEHAREEGYFSFEELADLAENHSHPVCETAKETQMYRTVFWTPWERERVGRFGRKALKHVKYHV